MKMKIISTIILIILLVIISGAYFIYNNLQSSNRISEQARYYINNKEVAKKDFDKLKSQLNISLKVAGGETLITPEGSDGGSEEHYNAVNIKTQEKYSYSVRYWANDKNTYYSLNLLAENL